MADWPGQVRSANDLLTTMTCGASPRSAAATLAAREHRDMHRREIAGRHAVDLHHRRVADLHRLLALEDDRVRLAVLAERRCPYQCRALYAGDGAKLGHRSLEHRPDLHR
jgi:hypothetical protein